MKKQREEAARSTAGGWHPGGLGSLCIRDVGQCGGKGSLWSQEGLCKALLPLTGCKAPVSASTLPSVKQGFVSCDILGG